MGIVVPITGEQNGILFRAYRHGEDVIFGEAEEKLCTLMLKNFSISSDNKPIPHFWTEKLLVLLLKIGVHKKIFREFIYDNPPKEVTRIVSVKNYLFGQVLKEQVLEPTKMDIEPVYLNEDQKSQWLSNILLDKKYLSRDTESGFYNVEETDLSDINSNACLEAENIGDIFGTLYKSKDKPRLVSKDLVLLTSCLNPNDISASMAAEIFIFRNKWERYKSFLTREAVNANKYFEIIRSIRHNNQLWTAVNSGQDKFKDFKTKKGHTLIQQISDDVKANRILARNWKQFWSANMDWDDTSINSELKELMEKEAHWLFKSNIYLRTLDLLFRKLNRLSGQEEITINTKLGELESQKDFLSKENVHLKEALNIEAKIQLEIESIENVNKPSSDKVDLFNNEIENAKALLLQTNPRYKELVNALEKSKSETKAIQSRIKKATDKTDLLDNEIKDLRNGIKSITEEVSQKLNEIKEYSETDSKYISDFVSEVSSAMSENNIEAFKNAKLINSNIKKLDECYLQSKLILDKVDLIVSPFGKVEYAVEYPHAFFVDFNHNDEFERKEIESLIFSELNKFEKETFRFKEKVNPGVSSFYQLPFNKNGIERGVWILGKGSFAKTRLVKLITILFETLNGVCDFKIYYFPNLPANSIISIQAKNNNNVKFGFFYDRALKVINHFSTKSRLIPELVSVATSKEMTEELANDIPRDSEKYFRKSTSENLDIDTIVPEQISVTRFNPRAITLTVLGSEPAIKKKIPTVVILTAINEEYSAVREHLIAPKDADQNDTNYESGMFKFNEKEIAKVFIRECGAKNTTAAQETERAIQYFKPDMIFFVGIAGSRKPNDFSIGDVIFPEKVYSYEGGKSEKDSFVARPDIAAMTYALKEIAKKERRKNDWKAFVKGSWESDFKADLGVIASGEQIVEHYESEIGEILRKHYNDTSAVEMEGFGFATAAIRQGRETSNLLIGIVRGISDIIEQPSENTLERSNDRRPANAKKFASDTAAAFAFWLIQKAYE